MASHSPKPHLFCFGLGFTGRALARALAAEGWRVSGTCRTEQEYENHRRTGIEALVFDGSPPSEAVRRSLADATHVLSTIPPGTDGDPVLRHFAEPLVQTRRHWVGYLSTTGVYGNRDGGWVEESTEPAPDTARSQRRLETEHRWTALHTQSGLPLHIFRLAAIYGPGRNTLLRVREGKARRIDKRGQVFCRIHLEDVVQILRASMNRPQPGAIYNVADDAPAPPAEVVTFACALLGVEPPPVQSLDTADLSDMARSFYQDSKRVSNRRIKEELGVTLRYPDYRSGLTALAAQWAPDASS